MVEIVDCEELSHIEVSGLEGILWTEVDSGGQRPFKYRTGQGFSADERGRARLEANEVLFNKVIVPDNKELYRLLRG